MEFTEEPVVKPNKHKKPIKGLYSTCGKTVRYILKGKYSANSKDLPRNKGYCTYCESHHCYDPFNKKNLKVKEKNVIEQNIRNDIKACAV